MKVYRSNRLERLAGALVDELEAGPRPPVDAPIVPEMVVVASQGMERWLSLQIAERLGVCTAVEFPFPGELVRRAFGAALELAPERLGLWGRDRLTWALLDLLPGMLADERFAPLRSYVQKKEGSSLDERRLATLSARIADTFDRYVTYRPEMVLGWSAGGDEGGDWQPLLWRALEERLGRDHLAAAAERFFALAREGSLELSGLPPRIFVFGASSLPPFYVKVLASLSEHREVSLFVPTPSREYWADTRSEREIDAHLRREGKTADELRLETPPALLASFGRLYRDFQDILVDAQPSDEPRGDELFEEPLGDTVLGRLQHDMLDLVTRGPQPGAARAIPFDAETDDSVRLHACHGPMRQVEALRDALVSLFDGHPELEPRDVVVMTPDLETYSPLVDAVFSDGDEGHRKAGFPKLPFQVADRSLRSVNAVAEALLTALELGRSRLEASAVLDFLGLEPVRSRFGIAEADLDLLRDWTRESGARWGADEQHRHAAGQPGYRESTWLFGLDRLLLGVALPGEGQQLWQDVLPYDEIEGSTAELLGSFARAVHALVDMQKDLARPRRVPAWIETLKGVLETFVDASGDRAGYARRVLRELLAVEEAAREAGFGGEIELDALLALLRGAFESAQSRGGFLGGRITLCGMVPMRGIPFDVVCLLGMDDGAFPRLGIKASFDRVEKEPKKGDRTLREDDLAVFLDAVLAARKHLVVTYTGRSVTTNEAVAPAVPVGQLLDVLDAGFEPAGGGTPSAALTVQHPIQPFSPRCFGAPDELGASRKTSHDQRALDGARQLLEIWQGRKQAASAPPLFDGPLPATVDLERPVEVGLADLARFLKSPYEWLLSRRLGLRLERKDEALRDREPIELDGLEQHAVGSDVLAERLGGEATGELERLARAAGRLPPGRLGERTFEEIDRRARGIAEAAARLPEGEPLDPLEVSLPLGDARLTGRLDGLTSAGQRRAQFGSVHAHQRLDLWVRHLAMAASGLELPSRLVGRDKEKEAEVVELPPVAPGDARALLERLTDVYLQGQRLPVPFFPATSLAYAQAYLSADEPDEEARRRTAEKGAEKEWIKSVGAELTQVGDGTSVWVQRLAGSDPPCPASAEFAIPGLEEVELPSFHDLALEVWQPVIERGGAGGES